MEPLIFWVFRKLFKRNDGRVTKSEADRFIVQQLRAQGADMDRRREVNHYLYLPSAEASRAAAEALRQQGYSVQEQPAANADQKPPNPFLVLATSETVLNPFAVQQFRELFERLASTHAGEYDGWEAAAKP